MSARSTYRFLERLVADPAFERCMAKARLRLDAWLTTAKVHGFSVDIEELRRVVEELLERPLDAKNLVAELHTALKTSDPEPGTA